MRYTKLDDIEADTSWKDPEKEPSIEERMEFVELCNLIRTRWKDRNGRTLVYALIILVLNPWEISADFSNVFRDIQKSNGAKQVCACLTYP